ncbi:MAG: hypothetical protein A2V83_04230 [Nitrospirae bacterium RBG_16_64_22]|nr:MAG: hypothetical protein A2V83_04230 [Nitrospirae bacterium RBG_16_64_22]
MQTKLTLRLEKSVIRKAKTWGKKRGISLSQAVSEFFSQLPEKPAPRALSPWTQGLAGIASGGGRPNTDEALRAEYLDHLEKKHG